MAFRTVSLRAVVEKPRCSTNRAISSCVEKKANLLDRPIMIQNIPKNKKMQNAIKRVFLFPPPICRLTFLSFPSPCIARVDDVLPPPLSPSLIYWALSPPKDEGEGRKDFIVCFWRSSLSPNVLPMGSIVPPLLCNSVWEGDIWRGSACSMSTRLFCLELLQTVAQQISYTGPAKLATLAALQIICWKVSCFNWRIPPPSSLPELPNVVSPSSSSSSHSIPPHQRSLHIPSSVNDCQANMRRRRRRSGEVEGEVKSGPSTSPTPLWPPSLKARALLSLSASKKRKEIV